MRYGGHKRFSGIKWIQKYVYCVHDYFSSLVYLQLHNGKNWFVNFLVFPNKLLGGCLAFTSFTLFLSATLCCLTFCKCLSFFSWISYAPYATQQTLAIILFVWIKIFSLLFPTLALEWLTNGHFYHIEAQKKKHDFHSHRMGGGALHEREWWK